jgi:hypothetical protein
MPRQQSAKKHTQIQTHLPQPIKAPTSFQYTGPVMSQAAAAPSFGQIVKEGFGFGVGASVARQLVDKMIGGGSGSGSGPIQPQPIVKKEHDITSPVITDSQRILYNQCIIEGGIHDLCKEILQ